MLDRAEAAAPSLAASEGVSGQPLRQQIKEVLARRIISGHYRGGERLVELRIAEQFGTSQAPVREALRDLDVTGLVESVPRRGTFVSSEILRSVRDIFFVRGALEESAARVATIRLCGDVADLQTSVDAMVDAAAAGDTIGVIQHSVTFHSRILHAAASKLLIKIWLSLQIEMHTTVILFSDRIDLMKVATCHQPIVDAMAAQDPELAAQLSREHQDEFEAKVSL